MEYSPPLSVVVGLLALQGLYLLCVHRYRDRFADAGPVGMWRQLAFSEGVVILLIALASPLDALADRYLFTAHMVQHLLITLVAAPLLLAGTPAWLLRELFSATHLTGLMRVARHPLIAFFSFNLVFGLAHVPGIYEVALANEGLHALEHLIFLATAVVMWMPVLSPLPELPPYPPMGQLLYLFLQTVPASLLGALLANPGVALYSTYVLAPRVIPGFGPADDQQLGALLMWVGSGLYFLLASAFVFFAWASREEAANRRPVGAH